MAKKAGKKGKAAAKPAKGGGFGVAKVASAPTAQELLRKSMDLYEELERSRAAADAQEAADLAKDDDDAATDDEAPSDSVTKYAVAVRVADSKEFSDWVPIAILAVQCGGSFSPTPLVPGAIGVCVKEVIEAGCQAYPGLRKLPRSGIEYAHESLDSFSNHVFEGLSGSKERRVKAAATLDVDVDADSKAVKVAHRKLMMELHPDRFVGDEEGAAAAQERMLEVQDAYAEMGGGQGTGDGSWYAAVGGKARVDFSGALGKEALGPLGKPRDEQAAALSEGGWRAAVFPFETSVVKEFITRNVARATQAQ